jgi:hypothetical protein
MGKALAKKVLKDFKKADGKNDAKLLKSVLKKDVKAAKKKPAAKKKK